MQLLEAEKQSGHAMFRLSGATNQLLEMAITNCFAAKGYHVKSSEGDKITFERGNRVLRLLFGAFVKYYKFSVSVQVSGDNATVYFDKGSTGISGGVIGMVAIGKEFTRMAEELGQCLKAA